MNILNSKLDDITFDVVCEQCESGHPEGVQLDYKEEYPAKDLSRLIAAFANTRGGTIIVGVRENKTTGKPETWEGIDQDARLIERVHQQALSISPLPKYQTKFTDSKNGKVFLIISVDEGDNTPYYVKNDFNVWVRTGNIRNPIEIASPEWQELLFRKRNTADKSRKSYITTANTVFDYALKLEDRRRMANIAEAKLKNDGSDKNYYQKALGSDVEWCTIYVQPYFPREALITPRELKEKLHDFRYQNNYSEFPRTNSHINTVPQGLYLINHSYNGSVDCQQLYGSGLMFHRFDVLRPPSDGDSQPVVYLSHILSNFSQILFVARKFYNYAGFQGQVKTKIELQLTRENIRIIGLGYGDPFFWDNYKDVLLPKYDWDFSFDTAIINDNTAFAEKITAVVREVHWDLGFSEVGEVTMKKFLIEQGIVEQSV